MSASKKLFRFLRPSTISGARDLKEKDAQANQLDPGRSFWELTDIKIRHAQLAKIIRTVKSHADLKLNNKLDLLIEQKVDDVNDGIDDLWEVLSCPDLAHGKEKVSPEPDYDCLNTSFPGLN